jgi:AsmA protein
MNRWLKIGGIALAVILVIIIALPFLINVNSFRPRIESELGTALGRPVTLGNLGLSLLTGNLSVDNISIADDPAFSKSPFVTAKSLKVGVEMMPLIFSKQLNVTGITLEEPQITLLKSATGNKWNYSSVGGTSSSSAPSSSSGQTKPGALTVAKLNINNGRLVVGKVGSKKQVVYDKVDIEVSNFSFQSQFPFKLTASLPGGGGVNVSGKAGPINSQDAAKTPFETAVKVNNLSIGSAGIMDPSSGIAGLANFDGTLNSDGSKAKAVGLFTGNKMVFAPKGTPAPKTVTIKHSVDLDLDAQKGNVTQGDVAVGSSIAHLTGGFDYGADQMTVNMKLNAPSMSVDELEAMLPSMGIVLPSGSQLKGGTLTADLGITGPVDKLVITGPVKMSNSKLANFDLGKKMGALSAFAGKAVSNPDTTIQNFSLDARMAPEGTKADNINLTVPAIGVITGAGTVSPAGALNFKMLANLQGGMMGGLSHVAGGSKGGGIGFAVEGTTADPKIVPDVGSVVGGLAGGAIQGAVSGKVPGVNGSPTSALGGLLGKKKK